MVSICFYFQVHQPLRINNYSVFDIGNNPSYFNLKKNVEIINKVSDKCYLPANKLMLKLIKENPEFKISYSFSGIFLDQISEFRPDVLTSFQELFDTNNVEILDETYYHSLSYLYSKDEFEAQVIMHRKKIKELFNFNPEIFRNTELIYNNQLAKDIENLGYKGILAEGADRILGWRSPNFIYEPQTTNSIKLLLKDYHLSDDIAFRFSNRSWSEWPLTAPKFSEWVNSINGNGNCVNLFMDYETFGEHQWDSTGIFEFLRYLPSEILKNRDNNFMTPSELVKSFKSVGRLDIPAALSWADVERDLSAWTGNKMQQLAIKLLYEMENSVKSTMDIDLLKKWRTLQTSDHFYYMCTKWFNDGDVHKYFNPFDSPYDCFISYMNILKDIRLRIEKKHLLNKVRKTIQVFN